MRILVCKMPDGTTRELPAKQALPLIAAGEAIAVGYVVALPETPAIETAEGANVAKRGGRKAALR